MADNLPVDVSDLSLSVKEIKFVGSYCANGFDAVAAMKDAGLIPPTTPYTMARLKGIEISNRPNVRTAVQRFTENVLSPYRDQLRVQTLDMLKARAFYDESIFYHPDGTAKPLDAIPREWRYAIDGVTEDFRGKDANVRTVNYKLADRMSAAKMLQELLKVKEEESSTLPTDATDRLRSIFNSMAKAGAIGAMEAMKQKKRDNDQEEPINVTPTAPKAKNKGGRPRKVTGLIDIAKEKPIV